MRTQDHPPAELWDEQAITGRLELLGAMRTFTAPSHAAVARDVIRRAAVACRDPAGPLGALHAAAIALGRSGGDLTGVLRFVFALRDDLARSAEIDRSGPSRGSIDDVVDAIVGAAVAARIEVLEDHALTDVLTGLGNRRALESDLDVEVARAKRTGVPLTVAVIDLDGLKEINDRDGHHAGDDALRGAANALQGLVRRSDRAYRQGGDEFALVLSDSVVVDPAVIVERLQRQGGPRCSVGLASSSGDDPDDLLAIADARMYAGRRIERRSRPFLDAAF